MKSKNSKNIFTVKIFLQQKSFIKYPESQSFVAELTENPFPGKTNNFVIALFAGKKCNQWQKL